MTDNATIFRSSKFDEFISKWGCNLRFRCAYVPEGNSIVERVHRSIKRIAARTQCDIREAVYLYNITPLDDVNETTAPINAVHQYLARIKGVDVVEKRDSGSNDHYKVGDEVWVKGPQNRCFKRFKCGRVTKLISPQAVEVDGLPRHVKDIRRRVMNVSERSEGRTDEEENEIEDEGPLLVRFSESDTESSVSEEEDLIRFSESDTESSVNEEDVQEGQAEAPRRSGRERRPPAKFCC